MPPADAQLLVDVLQVEPHGALRHAQLLGNFGIVEFVQDPPEGFGLSRGQAEGVCDLLEVVCAERLGHVASPPRCRPNGRFSGFLMCTPSDENERQ